MLVNASVAFARSSLVTCFGRSKEAFPQLPPPPPPPEGKETKSDLERVFGKHCCNRTGVPRFRLGRFWYIDTTFANW